MGVPRGSFVHMAMQGLVPLLSGALMVTGTIRHQSAKVRLSFLTLSSFEVPHTDNNNNTNSNNNNIYFFAIEQVFAHDQELHTEEDCMGIKFDFSTEMKLNFPATATMICLEKPDCAALEKSGIPVYQNVKVCLFFRVHCLP